MATEMRIKMPDATAAELRRVAALHRTTPGEVIRRLLVLRKRVVESKWDPTTKLAQEACIGRMPQRFCDEVIVDSATAGNPLPAGEGS